MRLTDLFSTLATAWPVDSIDTSFPSSTDGSALAALMTDSIEVEDVAADVMPDGSVTITGTLKLVDNLPPPPTAMVSSAFPSCKIQFAAGPDWSSDFRVASLADGAYTLQVDTLPLKVSLPPDLLRAHPDPEKRGIDSGIELAELAGDSVISRDFSFTIEADGAIRIESHLPISVGPCCIFGFPAKAVHDLSFIASPSHARAQVDWLVRPLNPDWFLVGKGGLAFGGIELDFTERSALLDVRKRLKLRDDAELVIEDLVLPSVFPIPLHGSAGIRRRLDPGEPLLDFLTFQDAPVVVPLGEDAQLFLSKVFFSTPEDGAEWWSGLTLEGGVAFTRGVKSDLEAEFGLIDGDVLRASFARVPSEIGDPVPFTRLDLWKIFVDIFRVRAGISLKELQKDSPSPGSAIQGLVDIIIRGKPGEPTSAKEAVHIEAEDPKKPFEAAITDVGWDRGKMSGNLVMPKGAKLKLSKFALEIREMGLSYEQGATYAAISGAIREGTSPLQGSVWFNRLRGRIAGNPDAPDFLLGGIGAELKVEKVVEVMVQGMYREQLLPDGTRIKEQGLGGGLTIYAGGNKWGLTTDLFWGERVPVSGDRIDYLLMLVALYGAIPMGPLELRGIEAMYARSLMPKIDETDRKAGDLKYYSWLKRARPTALPENRGLEAWKPVNDAWAFGVGLGISVTGGGNVFQITAFGAGFDSPDASGLIIVVDFGMFGSKKPLATGVFEYDFRKDAFVLNIQVDVGLHEIIGNFPPQLKMRLGGTITIGNKPGLIAFGRLNQPDTWIGANLEVELAQLFKLKARAALCVEWMEDTHTGGGFVLSVSVEGKLKGVIELKGWGALEVLLRYMLSGTNDFVARLRFEMGFAVVLFGFLRVGISLEMLAEWLAHVPNYFVFRVTFRFETPWFLPDVSYTLDSTTGTLEPTERDIVTSPLLQASAGTRVGVKPLRLQRRDAQAGGAATKLSSVSAVGGSGATWQGAAVPVALDACIEINFSVMLIDALGIGNVNPDFGEQISGDGDLALSTRYTLKGISVRRRPLAGGAWETVEELTDASSPRRFRWFWDADTRIHGETAPKKLLLNGSTPFTVGLENPLADAEILEDNAGFPCCKITLPDKARFDFRNMPMGPLPDGFIRPFHYENRATVAPVRIHGVACAVRPPYEQTATLDRVGAFFSTNDRVFTLSSTDDVATALMRVCVPGRKRMRLALVAIDAEGEEILRQHVDTLGSTFVDVKIDAEKPFRMLHTSLETLEAGQKEGPGLTLEYIECVMASDQIRFVRDRDRCNRVSNDGLGALANFLAGHEYEVAITTEIAVRHSATDWEATDVVERVSFTTSGPPGLNETPEPGLELAPYVVSLPPGGRGTLYREESVHMVLSDSLRIFGPGSGAAETNLRMPVTVVVESAFDALPEARVAKSSRESADWFLEHRSVPDPWLTHAVLDIISARTRDRRIQRYQALSEASTGSCEPDAVWDEQQPRIGVSPFDAEGRPLWDSNASYIASLRIDGAPVVERAPFETADINALSAVTGAWSVVDGALTASAQSSGVFGDADWDLLRLDLRGTIAAGGHIGAAVLFDTAKPAQGIRAFIRRNDGDGGTLTVESSSGALIESKPLSAIGNESGLTIEVFADAIRCSCGAAVVSVPRGDRTAGRCAVMAGDASIHSLRVRGIDMYRLPFRTSRYEGFQQHINSNTGIERYDTFATAEPLSTLLSRVTPLAAVAMAVESSNADRESLFQSTASALAMPLREDPERLHITIANSSADRWLVLESPEPIDFVLETSIKLEQRVVRPGLSAADRERLGRLIEQAVAIGGGGGPRPPVRPLPVPTRTPTVPGRGLENPRIEKVAYTVRLVTKFLVVTELATGTQRKVSAALFTAEDRALLKDVVVDLSAAFKVVRWHVGDLVEWVDKPLLAVQNADATKAILLPQGVSLPNGAYRLTFAISRRWFDTLAPAGPDNTYSSSAALLFDLFG
ncbi:MAG: hypothetical protein ACO1Q7_04380 [Gemmatimonas sp.]